MSARDPHVVIVGAGFGGLGCANALKRVPVRVTIVDRTNHHLFQPLLYQVAMAGLAPNEIAAPIRSVVRRHRRTQVFLAEVQKIDLESRTVHSREEAPLHYDYLVVAAGAENHWFGHADWAKHAIGLKDLDEAIEIRRRVLVAFESAEREDDEAKRRALTTFVVIGGGPTGVELAGALAELSRKTLSSDFRTIRPASARVVLLEGNERLLGAFHPTLSESGARQLEELGVEVRLGARVTAIDADGVTVGDDRISCKTVLWAAGVKPSPLAAQLGVPLDRQGRVIVERDCSLPGRPEVFVVGDMAHLVEEGAKEPLPGLCPVALQQGRHVARQIERSLWGIPRQSFHYWDKGTMATMGRSRAIAQIGDIRLSGMLAWLAWLAVHIWFLIDFRNRLFVLAQWFWAYLFYRSGARLITGHRMQAGAPE